MDVENYFLRSSYVYILTCPRVCEEIDLKSSLNFIPMSLDYMMFDFLIHNVISLSTISSDYFAYTDLYVIV